MKAYVAFRFGSGSRKPIQPRRSPTGAVAMFFSLFAGCLLAGPGNDHSGGASPRHHHWVTGEQHAEKEYLKRAYPLQQIPSGAMGRALAQTQESDSGPGRALIYHWYNIGPAPVKLGLPLDQGAPEFWSGRVPAVAVDPSSPTHWLIGAALGGVWETTDSGQHWYPRTDSQASLAIGALAFAPGSPSLVFAGTGEPNFRGDVYAGQGLLVSHDGGTSWAMQNNSFADTSFSHILVDPGNANNLTVSTVRGGAGIRDAANGYNVPPGAPPRGVFTSIDGGTSFSQVLFGEATALAANPVNFAQQYAALGEPYGAPTNGIYRTTDSWGSSQLINGPWTALATPTQMGRMALAFAPSAPATLYVGVSGTRTNYVASLLGIWRTDNAWDATPSWTALPLTDGPSDIYADEPQSFPRFWYYFDLLVDQTSADTLYLANSSVWQYAPNVPTNGPPVFTWNNVANGMHLDQHVMAWVPYGGNYSILLGNDAGAWFSGYGVGGSWTSLNGPLAITEIYKGAVDPTHGSLQTMAGAQDEYTEINVFWPGSAWATIWGGDGGDCAIAASAPSTHWAMSAQTDDPVPKVAMERTPDGGWTVNDAGKKINSGILPFYQQFFVHFEKAPYNDDLFIAGTAQLWRCNDFFSSIPNPPSWQVNSPVMLDISNNPVPISAMAFAPSDTTGQIYAFGTEDGQLRITSNGGMNWSDLNPANVVPKRYISGLAFSPIDPNTLYVTLSGFDENTPGHPGHLFKTANALASPPTWVNVSPPVDLPNNCLAIDTNSPNTIYVGTDLGVWLSLSGGGVWSHFGPSSGMPNVAVYDLRIDSGSRVTAFTHGRSAYVLSVTNVPIIVYVAEFLPFPIGCAQCPPPGCYQCPPGEPWLNPGDLVTVRIPLESYLPVNTVDLQATMLATPGITPITGTQDYGVLLGQGPAVSRQFSFRVGMVGADGFKVPCGGTVPVVLQLTDQGTNIGQVNLSFPLGTPSYPLGEDFEGVIRGGLPPGWSSAGSGAAPAWTVTTNSPPNLPSGGEDDFLVLSNSCAFTPDPFGVGQSYLTTPGFPVSGPQAQLYFRMAFSVSPTNDGCILEISSPAGVFEEITQAGGSFRLDGYNARLSDRNPLGPRPAWSGDSGGWLPVWVNLPPAAAGQVIQFRWHFANSFGLTNGGWFVDSVRVTDPVCLPPVINPVILNPAILGSVFTFAIDTVTNRTYLIEYKTNLTDTNWQALETLTGDGTQQTVRTPLTPGGQSYYRFQVR